MRRGVNRGSWLKGKLGRPDFRIMIDCGILASVCAVVWLVYGYLSGLSMQNAPDWALRAHNLINSREWVVPSLIAALYGLPVLYLFRWQGTGFGRFLWVAIPLPLVFTVLCFAMSMTCCDAAWKDWGKVALGVWVIAFSATALISGLNLLFIIPGTRILGAFLLLVVGSCMYASDNIQYYQEHAFVKVDPIRPLHVVNQLVGITLPSRGILDRGGKLYVWGFQFIHLLVYLFFISFAFSFADKEMLHRLALKLFAWRKLHLFWDGSEESQLVLEDSLRKLRLLDNDSLLVVFDSKKGRESDHCNRLKCKWISADVKSAAHDHIVLGAHRHYFLGTMYEDNIKRAIEVRNTLVASNRTDVNIYVNVGEYDDRIRDFAIGAMWNWSQGNTVKIKQFCESFLVVQNLVAKLLGNVTNCSKVDVRFLAPEVSWWFFKRVLKQMKIVGDGRGHQIRNVTESTNGQIISGKIDMLDFSFASSLTGTGPNLMETETYEVIWFKDELKAVQEVDSAIKRGFAANRILFYLRSPTIKKIVEMHDEYQECKVFGQLDEIYTCDNIEWASAIMDEEIKPHHVS